MYYELFRELNKLDENQNKLEENLLVENLWFEVSDIANPKNLPFYYYAKDLPSAQSHLINMLNGEGTPHQSLNRNLLNSLRALYKGINAATFPTTLSLTPYRGTPPNPNRRLVKNDRVLRSDAQKFINSSTTPPTSKYLIHHIDGDEANNNLTNINLIDSSIDPILAKCAHQILHSSLRPGTYNIPIYSWNGATWVVSATYQIII